MGFFAQDVSGAVPRQDAGFFQKLFRRGRPRPSAWELRPSDRIPLRYLAREPLLRDIENNPVFRLFRFTWRARSANAAWMFGAITFFVAFQISIGLLISAARLSRHLIGFAMPLAGIIFALTMAKRGAQMHRGLFGIPPAFVEDLRLTSVTPRDFAIGFWGAAQRPRFFRANAWFCALFAAAAWLFIIWPGGVPTPIRFVAAAPLLFCGMTLVMLQFIPHVSLQALAMGMGNLRRGLEFSIRPWKILRALLLMIVRMLLWTAVGILAIFIMVVWLDRASQDFRFGLGVFAEPWVWGLIASAAGAFIGLIHGRYIRRHAEKYLERIERDYEFVMRNGVLKDGRLRASRDS